MKDQKALILKGEDFDSLYSRGTSGTSYDPVSACPPNGFTQADQIRYTPWGLQCRPGTAAFSLFSAITNIAQIIPYQTNKSTTLAQPITGYFIVSHAGGNTNVYDSNAAVPANAIDTVAGHTYYISLITIYNRIAFTYHDYTQGAGAGTGAGVYQVYQPGDALSRDNGRGTVNIVTAGTNFASSATAGNVTVGDHIFGVVGITRTGHISVLRGVSEANKFNIATASKSVDATNLPLGGAEVVERWILASRVISGTYSGNPEDYEVFFVHKVADNTTVNVTFDFTDESLVDSADYLYDITETSPCGINFTFYADRLISWGTGITSIAGENVASLHFLRISEKGKPESVSDSHGYLAVFPDDGTNGVLNAWEYKGLLVIQKGNKTLVTRDNGDDPNTWDIDIVDGINGGLIYGVSRSLSQIGSTRVDYAILLNQFGVHQFDGKFGDIPLTWKIERLWQKISENSLFDRSQIIDIPTAKLFVILVRGATEFDEGFLLVCDYSKGLGWQTVRWSVWILHSASIDPIWIALNTNTQLLILDKPGGDVASMIIGTEDSELLTDYSLPIENGTLITGELTFDNEMNTYQNVNIRMRGRFSGVVTLEWVKDGGSTTTLQSIPSARNLSSDVTQVIINQPGFFPRIKFTFGCDATDFFNLKRLVLFGNESAVDLANP